MRDWLTRGAEGPRPVRLAGRFVARRWQALVVGVVVVALGVAAYLSPGMIQADVRLDSATVYAGNRNLSLVGTVNTQIKSLTAAAAVGDTSFRIMQHEDLVLVHSTQTDRMARYFPATNRLSIPTQLPAEAQVQLVGNQLLVINPVDGRAWVGPAETLLEYDFDKEQADLEIGEQSLATLTTGGNVIGLDPKRGVLTRQEGDEERLVELPFEVDPAAVSLSAVGERALVLDRAAGRIWLEGMEKAFDVSGADGARLMAPAPDALGGEDGARAIYATRAGLIALTNDGPRSLSGQLDAVAIEPIQVGDCVYGAFGNHFVRKCVGQAVHVQDIPNFPSGAQLTFAANRSSVILNDLAGGNVWLVDQDMALVTNWRDVVPEDADNPDSDPEVEAIRPPDREELNRPPVANDDTLYARAGRSTLLPVLDNDTDPDADVLTISAPPEVTGARLSPVNSGAGLQITIDPDATGTITFNYQIDDGRDDGTATATVTVQILPADPTAANTAPHRFELAQDVDITQRQILTKQVLLDWRDADGDPLILKDAWLDEGSEDRVAFTSDGSLTFTDVGKTTGGKVVHLLVSDGVAETAGQLKLNVSADPVAPIAHGDFATTTVGEAVEIEPIANDVGFTLRLSEVVTDCERCLLQPDYPADKLTFQAPEAGTYYLTYTVRSAAPAVGLIRVDVREPGVGTPPIVAADVAMLPLGGSVTIDPLLNDYDADGDVLVIQTITPHPGLEVVLERRHLVRISSRTFPTQPITLEYRVSDGFHSVVGHIVVVPAETTGTMNPQPRDDAAAVRAGSTVAVNVLSNDESPAGLGLRITRLLRNPLGEDAWVAGDQLRLRAPAGASATSTSVDYEVVDTDGRPGVATVQVEISAEDSNAAPPQPRKVVDRVLAGTTTRIPIDLTGIDPSGSSVRLVGIASGPKLGRIVGIGERYLTYEAYAGSQGTDTFLYEVINRVGMRATGQIRVGVAPAGARNNEPTGVSDEISVRPGRPVQLAVLANDYDLDGDTIGFAPEDPVTFLEPGLDATIVEDREVFLTAPKEPGSYGGTYRMVDGRGLGAVGTMVVTVDPVAPLAAPITRDDTVPVAAIADQEWVEVDVLANDYDPDGAHQALQVQVLEGEGGARVSGDGRRLTVPVLDQMQQLRYSALDADGNFTYGIVTVPGLDDSVPVLRDQTVELEAVAGKPLSIPLEDYVVGSAGRRVRLTTADKLSATNGVVSADGPEALRFIADAAYQGPASVVFEVTDLVEDGDDTAKTAYLTMRIKVLPPEDGTPGANPEEANEPPQLVVDNATLQVAPGEGEERLNLVGLFHDPEGQDIYIDDMAAVSGDERIAWRMEGSTLIASAPADTPTGATLTLSGTANDASTGHTPFTVQLVVISSRQPLAEAVEDHVARALAGQAVEVPVLANDVSFLADPTLTVVGAQVITGEASITHQADRVTITPAPGTSGTVIARYTVADATGDPARHVDGRITVVVQDRPAQPDTPYPAGTGDGEVTVTYNSGGDGGSPVTRRIATASSPGRADVVQDCLGERCTITGLRNGVPWTVSIVEVNEHGRSEPSAPSAPQTPDAKPLAPSRPSVEFGDGALTVSWTHETQYASEQGGSPIQGYHIYRLDAAGAELGMESVSADERSFTWSGLTNGAVSVFRVVAYNSYTTSDPSPDSLPEYPSGRPTGSQTLSVQAIENDIGGGFSVTFDASLVDPNGTPGVDYFTVTPVTESEGELRGFAQRVDDASGSTTVEITGMGTNPTRFVLRAANRSGTSVVGESGDFQVSYRRPLITKAEGTEHDGYLEFTVETNYADPALRLQYNLGAGWVALPSNGRITGLTNGVTYEVSFRALIGPLASPTKIAAPHTPRTGQPRPISLTPDSLLLGPDLSVTAQLAAPTLTASGGWDPKNYTWCGGTGGCTPSGQPGSVTFEAGRTGTFRWGYAGTQYGGTSSLEVASVQLPEYRGGHLRFRFPYVAQGSCTITATTAFGQTRTDVVAANQVVAFDAAVSGDTLRVACNLNGHTHNFQVK